MIFEIRATEQDILHHISLAAERLGFPVYIVGGYVRDRLLGRESKDMDIVCVGSGIKLAEKVAEGLFPRPKVVTYERFGTAMLRYRDMEIEFVGARKESYRSDSRKPMVENGTLEDDQLRRDFTINALAVSLLPDTFGTLVDPFDGIKDLEQKIIRTPLQPERTFSDDPLRMMRGIRFATQLNFQIEAETFAGICTEHPRLSIISKERILTELEKIMDTNKPSVGLDLLYKSGLLQLILPELTVLAGVHYQDGKGHKDNFYHTLQVLDNLALKSQNIYLRWSALFHDIGKAPTKRFEEGHGWTFHGHEDVGSRMVSRIFRRIGLPTDYRMKYVEKMVALHQRPIALTKEEVTDSALRRILFEAGEDIEDLMLLCRADITTKNPDKLRRRLEAYDMVVARLLEIEEKDRLRNWQPPISGEDIMATFGIKPGREVGIIKTAIREAILDGIIPNEYEAARNLMLKTGQSIGLNLS